MADKFIGTLKFWKFSKEMWISIVFWPPSSTYEFDRFVGAEESVVFVEDVCSSESKSVVHVAGTRAADSEPNLAVVLIEKTAKN